MFTQVNTGRSHVIMTIPHDGAISFAGASTRKSWKSRDFGTLELARSCNDELRRLGLHPTMIAFTLHRSHADPNRSPTRHPHAPGFKHAYNDFHLAVQEAIRRAMDSHGRCLLVDIHGCRADRNIDFIIGTRRHQTSPFGTDLKLVKNVNAIQKNTLGRSYRAVFSPSNDWDRGMVFSGGWIVQSTARHWAGHNFEAIQLELNSHLLFNGAMRNTAQDLAACLFKTGSAVAA